MKQFLSIILTMLLVFGLTACQTTNQPAESTPATEAPDPTEETQTPEEAKVLKILTIGNSHSNDANWLLYEAFHDQNPEQEVVIATMYYSGCSITQHVTFAMANDPVYEYNVNRDGTWIRTKGYTLQQALEAEQWDIVVIQESGAGDESKFTINVRGALVNYVNQHLTTPHRFIWNMSFPFPTDEIFYSPDYDPQPPSGNRDKLIRLYNFDPVLCLQKNHEMMQKYILPDSTYDYIIPTGTAIMHTTLVSGCAQTEIWRDYTHLTDYGRLVAAYAWYAKISGNTITQIGIDSIAASLRHARAQKLGDMDVTEEMKQVILAAANFSLENPWTIPGQAG